MLIQSRMYINDEASERNKHHVTFSEQWVLWQEEIILVIQGDTMKPLLSMLTDIINMLD